MNALPKQRPSLNAPHSAGGERRLVIGLLNNAPDGAFRANARRFAGALQEAAPACGVLLQSYALPEISRHFVQDHAYLAADALRSAPPDALVISGAEPRSADLRQEPYWQSLTAVIDWAKARGMPIILSCLAAHAAVLHGSGIPRQRLARKCSGVFQVRRRMDHDLLRDVGDPLCAPHSRWNTLPENQLLQAGYRILTSSAEAGVDMFVDPEHDSILYLNGHPEYDSSTLLKEYCRDVTRFIRREQMVYPDLPRMDIEGHIMVRLDAARLLAEAGQGSAAQELVRSVEAEPWSSRPWRTLACGVFGNWLEHVRAFAD